MLKNKDKIERRFEVSGFAETRNEGMAPTIEVIDMEVTSELASNMKGVVVALMKIRGDLLLSHTLLLRIIDPLADKSMIITKNAKGVITCQELDETGPRILTFHSPDDLIGK